MKYAILALAGALCAGSLSAQETGRTLENEHKQAIVPEGSEVLWDTLKFAPAVRAGDWVYLSGVVASRKEGEENNDAAYARAFEEIEATLAASGASWANVVDMTTYHLEYDTTLGEMLAQRTQRVGEPYPTWTAIGVANLYRADPSMTPLVEIKVTAYLGDTQD